jgi:hypothetical protein
MYTDQFNKTLAVIEHDEQSGSNPIKIAKKIASIITKKSPKLNYLVGKPDQVIFLKFKAILPAKLFNALLGWYYNI